MKIFRKRVPKGNALLFLSFAAISLCLLLIVSATRTGRENSLMRNNIYSGRQKNFYITGTEDKGQWGEVIPQLAASQKDFGLYVSVPSQEIPIRGVCLQGEVNKPPMVQGSFFDFSTSWTDSPKMVLGREFQGDAVSRGSRQFYQMEGIEFEVIGIMGTEQDSRANHMVFIDFQSAIRLAGINADYKLDAEDPSHIQEVGQEMSRLFGESANLLIILGDAAEVPFLAKALSSDTIMDTMYAMILISFSLSTILVTLIWLRFRRQLFFSWFLCGFERRLERMEICRRYYGVAGTGFAIGLLLMLALSGAMPDIQVSLPDMFLAFAVTVGLGTVILFFCYAYYRRKAGNSS